ncbi:hypothetical protein GQ600_27018 [Phytophthora cactorum]|nr:hypothetical protein GQ600_27018 [Phytophthora cactorum]
MTFGSRSRSAPFEPLHLTEKQQQECQDLTFQLLDRTLRSYDACLDSHSGTPRHHADLDRSRWKQLKTQANASLYAERTGGPWRDFHSPRGNCTLLAVGTIHDTLDEVMFGLETPDFAAIQLRSETLFKHRLDGAVLAQLAGPTETDPFQFMGITRMTTRDGDVDVFVQMHMETRCHLYNKLVIAEIWESALGFWNAPSLAEAKKLQWCLHQKSVLPWQSQVTSGEDNCIKSNHCKNCPSKEVRPRGVVVPTSATTARVQFACTEPAEIALDNQKQREAHQNNGSKREKKTRSAFGSGWGVPTFSPGRYPSISVSDLLRMVNSLSDVGINQVQRASQTMRRRRSSQLSLLVNC